MRGLLFYLLVVNLLYGQWVQQGADSVVSFIAGSGQNVGQDSAYFPMNVLGLPASSASATNPATSPSDICSLGFGGEIVLTFKGKVLVDGPGYDFTVFENAFYVNGDTNVVFGEPATVSVSMDGVNYVMFPIDSLTLEGCAGMVPTKDPSNPFDPYRSGGTPFDLSVIGMDSVRYIKIKDFTYYVYNNPSHPYYSPILSGFDLDAVVGLHLVSLVSKVDLYELDEIAEVYVNRDRIFINFYTNGEYEVRVVNVLGEEVYFTNFYGNRLSINLNKYVRGVYVIYIFNKNSGKFFIRKVLL